MKAVIDIPPWAKELLSDLTDMDRNPQPVVPGQPPLTLELPDDVYFEYAFRDAGGRVRADPANALRGENPWFPEVSAIVGPDYAPDPLAQVDPALATGSVTRHRLQSKLLGQLRRVAVYTPAGHDDAPLPLVVVQDGIAFFRIGRLAAVLEALLAAGAVRPARLAFVEPVDRTAEYGFAPDYRAFVRDELLPFLESAHPLTAERIWWGASLGGLFSATFALEHPELATTLVTQSGAFLGTPMEREFYRTERSWLLDELRARSRVPQRWYLEVGTLEWLTNINRAVAELLAAKGVDYAYAERHAGHNWTNWRNGLAAGLRFALAPEGA